MHVDDKVLSPRAVCIRRRSLDTADKRLDLEAPIFAYVCTLTGYIRLPIIIRILTVLDLHFQGKNFESNIYIGKFV